MTHVALPPFSCWSGPRDARLVIVGEAWGRRENENRKPFAGESGKELFQMLGEGMPHVAPALHAEIVALFKYDMAWLGHRDKWLNAASIAFTNTINLQPFNNDFRELCCKKADLPRDYALPSVEQGKYLRPEFLPELDRLFDELREVGPKLVVTVGAKASWAILGDTRISQIRGAIADSHLGFKVLPTYHPAGVLRNWSWRPIVVGDFVKAEREMHFAEIRRPSRKILWDPTIEEVEKWTAETLALRPEYLSSDTETMKRQITMISFARAKSDAICIPFVDKRFPGLSYWPDVATEVRAWNCVASLLESEIKILWQNGLYDMQYILLLGIKVKSDDDTMLLHHSLLPEMPKGLGFLGAAYTDEPSWKLMRKAKQDTEKRDE